MNGFIYLLCGAETNQQTNKKYAPLERRKKCRRKERKSMHRPNTMNANRAVSSARLKSEQS